MSAATDANKSAPETEKEKTITDEDAASAEARFQEQCFLLRSVTSQTAMGQFIRAGSPKKLSELIKVDSSDSTTLMNKITKVTDAEALFNITQKEIAYLQPLIRIFKVTEASEAGGTIETEFKFTEGSFETSGVSIFSDRAARGADVGLKNVSFELMATQPAEITNNIVCNVKLFFQNLKALTEVRTGASGNSYSFADLILRPPGPGEEYNPDHYRVKLMVGWAIPKLTADTDIRPELRDALANTRRVLNLTLKTHSFNFNLDGTVELDIEYHAWVEGALATPATDLLYPTAEDAKQLKNLDAAEEVTKKRQAELKQQSGNDSKAIEDPSASRSDADRTQEGRLERIKERRLERRAESRAKAYRRFLDMLLDSDLSNVYYIDIPASQLGKKTGEDGDDQLKNRTAAQANSQIGCSEMANLQAPGAKPAKAETGTANNAKEELSEAIEATKDNEKGDVADAAQEALGQLKPGLSPKDNGTYRVNYFYFGDLVNMCFHLLRKGFGETPGNPEFNNSAAGKVGFMLGPIILPNPCDPTQPGTTINIGDIPISVNLFTAWFTKKVIRPQRTRYLVRNFINDAIGELIPAALGDRCVDEAGRALLRVDTIPVSLKSTNNSTPPLEKGSSVQPNRLAELSSNLDYSSDGGTKSTWDYLLLFGTGFSPNWLGGSKEKDAEMGIYRLILGADVGPLKSISFSKNDAPYLGEAKVTGDNSIADDLGGGAVYNFSAELVGNSLFVPGQYIYIDTFYLGVGSPNADGQDGRDHSIANRLRLGGYYNISKVESTFERGNFTTAIEGIWESAGSKSERTPSSVTATEGEENQAAKDGLEDAGRDAGFFSTDADSFYGKMVN
tara:strand:+ start:965 stop:3508 length:2544 start_codon:yes stop_codon:yes gene_type:complete